VTRLVLGFVLLFISLIVLATASGMKSGASPRPGAALTRLVGLVILLLGVLALSTSSFVVIDAGSVGVRHGQAWTPASTSTRENPASFRRRASSCSRSCRKRERSIQVISFEIRDIDVTP